MKRLTRRYAGEDASVAGVSNADIRTRLGLDRAVIIVKALNKLAEYEDIGLTPRELALIVKEYAVKHEDKL